MSPALAEADLEETLVQVGSVMGGAVGTPRDELIRVGVDLGTAYTVVVVTDGTGWPIAGTHRFGQVVRDGVVVDFHGAIRMVSQLKAEMEEALGRDLGAAAAGYPPGVHSSEVRAVGFVLDAAGLGCSALVEEPIAANSVLSITDGAVVDIGGGTTGVAVFDEGRLVSVADEATGGTHLTLVIAGALGVSMDEAEAIKRDPSRTREILQIVRPVLEKIGTIVRDVVSPRPVRQLHLVGGTCRLEGIAEVIGAAAGVPASVPHDPMFVTALGLAHHDRREGMDR